MILLLKDLYGGKIPKGSTHNAVPCPPDKLHLRHLTWIHPAGFAPLCLLPSDYDITLPQKATRPPEQPIKESTNRVVDGVGRPRVELPVKAGTNYDLPSVKTTQLKTDE